MPAETAARFLPASDYARAIDIPAMVAAQEAFVVRYRNEVEA
jgi:hypothetical protein